eukprot:2910252-Prymnesium_polylepis.1
MSAAVCSLLCPCWRAPSFLRTCLSAFRPHWGQDPQHGSCGSWHWSRHWTGAGSGTDGSRNASLKGLRVPLLHELLVGGWCDMTCAPL